jgi:uncharacterized membrane protein
VHVKFSSSFSSSFSGDIYSCGSQPLYQPLLLAFSFWWWFPTVSKGVVVIVFVLFLFCWSVRTAVRTEDAEHDDGDQANEDNPDDFVYRTCVGRL